MALEWVTLEGYIGCIDKGEDASKLSIYAECSEDDGHNVKYELLVDDLPYGLSFNNNGTFSGICQTSEITNYHFSVRATAYNESTNEEFESIEGTFYIATNKPSYSELIVWTNDSIEGSYKCGESVLHQFSAYCENNDTIQYIFEDDNYPKGLHLTATGELYGTLLPQEIKAYTFNVKAYTKYASFTKAFTINVISGLGSSAVNCYLKLNHTNDDWYDDLKNQLDLTKTTNTYNDKYSVREFPQIDVAKLHCFDRELLSWMSGVRSENIETMVRVTVNPFPIDAKITITCDGYEQEVIDGVTQNYIIVPINSTIHWKAEYGDNVKEGDAIAVNHLTLNIALVEKKTITILPIPEDAKVSLKCDGYEQVGNQIVVPIDSTVRYIVSQENYNSVMDTVIADEDKDIEVVLGSTITKVDHLVIKIKFTDGKDLDTGTYFVNLENIPALQDVPELVYNSNSKGVGYLARGSTSMQYTPNTTSSVQNCILAFCGDNQNAGGEQYESIYINTKKLKEQYGSQLPAEVKIKITSCWWNTIGYNKPILSAAGYTGGYMDYSNYVFYNIGGELAGEINNEILNMDLSGTGRSHTRHIANVYWNTTTQRVRFEIIPKEN